MKHGVSPLQMWPMLGNNSTIVPCDYGKAFEESKAMPYCINFF